MAAVGLGWLSWRYAELIATATLAPIVGIAVGVVSLIIIGKKYASAGSKD
jgi:hypothetical protein